MPDGIHELRVVAYNNSQAASEGFNLVNVVVNNSGRVGQYSPARAAIMWRGTRLLSIPVSATQGTGPAISSACSSNCSVPSSARPQVISSGNVTFNASQIAYGVNTITPVANLASGKKIFGAPITITRQSPRSWPGAR